MLNVNRRSSFSGATAIMSSVFDDILNRAENLNSNNLLAEGSSQVQVVGVLALL